MERLVRFSMNSIVRCVLHRGPSFLPGDARVHFWMTTCNRVATRRAWSLALVARGLAGPMVIGPATPQGVIHASAEVSPILDAELAHAVAILRPLSTTYLSALARAEADAQAYAGAFGLHYSEAMLRGWVAMRSFVGTMPVTLAGAGIHAHMLLMNVTPDVAPAALIAGTNKFAGRELMRQHGLPIPEGRLVSGADAAIDAAHQLGFPVVLKRLVSSNGDGVAANLRSPCQIRQAFKLIGNAGDSILVEQCLSGHEYRLHFVAGRLWSVFRGRARTVVGDGRSSLLELIDRTEPGFSKLLGQDAWRLRRVLLHLVSRGLDSLEGIKRYVPPHGEAMAYTTRVGVGLLREVPKTVIHRDDRRMIERFLRILGSPSAGFDIVLRAPGKQLADGGAIFEMNVPCGFGYLSDPLRAVRRELNALVQGDASFARSGGRIPVTLVDVGEGSVDIALARRLTEQARAQLGTRTIAMDRHFAWLDVLGDHETEALLLLSSEEALLQSGGVGNLRPTAVTTLAPGQFRQRRPVFSAVVAASGGRVVRRNTV